MTGVRSIVILVLMLYFLIFLSELLLLFLLSRKLINSLSRLIYKFTRSHRAVVRILAFIFLPGTIIHELAHLLFAGVMLVPIGEMNVLPEIEEKGVKLGSVQIGHTDPLRRMVVGVAPVLLGLVLIFSIFLLVKIGVSPFWQVVLALYLLFEIGNTMFSSRKDIEGSILFLVLVLAFLAVISVFLYLFNPGFLQTVWFWLNSLDFRSVVVLLKQAAIYLAVPLILDILVILSAKLLF